MSPVKSFFPSVEPISTDELKVKVPEKSNVKRITNGIITNLNGEHHSSRKESLDSVDMELIKLGLHKSSEDIRSQYLSKLHITSPPSKISTMIMRSSVASTTSERLIPVTTPSYSYDANSHK